MIPFLFQKQKWDHSKTKGFSLKLAKYLEYDCRGLFECIEKFYASPILADANFKPTLASQSLEVMRKYITRAIPSINSADDDEFIRRGYAGGRVEIFRPIYQSDTENLNYYDFNSLYPSVMRNMDVPGKILKENREITPLSFVEADVACPKDEYLPLLWKKQGKFMFPTGVFSGVFPGIELLEAQARGCKILKVRRAVQFQNLGKLFTHYIDDLYRLKAEAKDEVTRQIAKLLLNAGYGRIAINRIREKLTIESGELGVKPLDVYIGNQRLATMPDFYLGFSNPAIGAMVTAHARIKLHRAMKPIQDQIYYCDTDSIVTTACLETSPEIGQLKLEGKAAEACFLLPKTYVFGKDVKMKGFPKEFAQSKNFQDFREAMQGELMLKTVVPGKGLKRIKSQKGAPDLLKVMQNQKKSIISKYDKRIIFRENNSFNSRPIHLI